VAGRFHTRHCAVIDAVHTHGCDRGRATTLIGVELGVAHADPDRFRRGVDPDFVADLSQGAGARLPSSATADDARRLAG